jgi:hypothetical protein
MPERNRDVSIKWNDSEGEWYVSIQQKYVDFTHKDNLIWNVEEPNNPLHPEYQPIDKFAIKFGSFPGCTTNSNVPLAWPCKDNPGKWLEEAGISEEGESVAKGNQKIQCNIRPGSTQKYVGSWDYCYSITAWSAGVELDSIDPIGGGSGCSGCHSTENTF